MKSCYVYIRVSTEDQKKHGYSPANQIRQATEFAKIQKFKVKRVFDDSGKSGKSMANRPELQELLKEVDSHPVDACIIYKIDRFARNLHEFTGIYEEFKKKGTELISISEGNLMQGSSVVANLFATIAQWESEVNSSRTKDALAQKFEEGWQPTRPPIGYRSVGERDEKKTCEPDPYEAPIIQELFEMYSTGNFNILEIQDWLADKNLISKNGTGLGHSVINGILNNPFYYGLIRWHGKSKKGLHTPIISKELYDICQYVLMRNRNFLLRRRTHDFLLRGFISCAECGQRYTAEWHKNERKLQKRGGKIAYYHCPKRDRNNCPAPYVEMSDLENKVAEEFKNLQFSEKFIDIVTKKARERVEINRKSASARRQAILNVRTSLETRRNRLEDNRLDDTIDRETYMRKHEEIQSKIESLDEQLNEVEADCKLDIDLIEEVLSFSRNIHQTYVDAPQFLKRHYMRFFYERFEVKDKEIVKAVPTPIFLVLQQNEAVILRKALLPR